MVLIYDLNKPAQITFTLDYHELLTGDLKPNTNCHISYDPLRIVPQDGTYIHGNPHQPITAHIQFSQNGAIEEKVLFSDRGITLNPHIDITGQGSMLSQEFAIPENAEEVIIWFTYIDPSTGKIYYDTDAGKNFHFRFPYQDISVLAAVVTSDPATPYSGFGVEVSAIPSITKVWVRFLAVNFPDSPKSEADLSDTGQKDSSGNKIFSAYGLAVSYHSIIRFKLYYELNGKTYKNDNSGKYFLAPEPAVEKVPSRPVAPRSAYYT
jgi:hypothetical protein